MARVWVAMSGGVDSSVAAALLLEAGHEVTGVTMQLWPSGDEEGGCCSVEAARDARRVCDLLGIPHYTLNYREAFEREVVGPFALSYARGLTPNPCIDCNARLKFSDLLAKVITQGADALATGHYARIVSLSDGTHALARGVDPDKDQSYFLYRLTPTQMEHVLFPVGELHKSEVRAFAERFGLPVAAKAESQDTCFEVGGRYEHVIEERNPEAFRPGDIVNLEGEVLGSHRGIAHYTTGQRRGLGIGGVSEPLYVLQVDVARNRLVVGPREALKVTTVEAPDVAWHEPLPVRATSLRAVVRYRMTPQDAVVDVEANHLRAAFDSPLEGVAPGQSIVCYRGDVVVGGGVIACAS